MRVTERAIFENARRGSAAAATREAKASEEAGTGIKVRHAWDSYEAGRVVRERVAAQSARAISDSAGRRLDELNAADGALATVNDALTSASVLAIQLANDSFGPAERQNAAAEVRANLRTVLGAMNTEVAGRYLFAGTADTTRPFDDVGNYLGDAGVLQIETAPGVTQPTSVRADVAIKGVGGGVDLPVALEAFAVALEANDVPGIRQAIGDLQAGIRQVSAARADAGGMQRSLEFAVSAAKELSDNATTRANAIVEVDFVEAAIELAAADRALEAALAVAAKSFDNTLLKRL